MVIVYTDKEIFGFDVGSRAANIATLIALILVIIWLALSTAYCITRGSPPPRFNHHNVPSSSVDRTRQSRDGGRGPGRGGGGGNDKSRRQKFEEYWGEMDSSTNSITPMHPTSDSESDCGSIEISDRVFSNQVDGQVLSSPFHASLYQQHSNISTLPPAPAPPQSTFQTNPILPPVLPKPPSAKPPPSSSQNITSDLLSLPETTTTATAPPLSSLSTPLPPLSPPSSSFSPPPPTGTGGTNTAAAATTTVSSSSTPPAAAPEVSNNNDSTLS
jgi:hypothetical protein